MAHIDDLRQLFSELERQPQSRGYDLRLSFADLVIDALRERHWTQKELADQAGLRESQISSIVHAESNCTFDLAGRILFALGIKAEFGPSSFRDANAETPIGQGLLTQRMTHGKEEIQTITI